MIWSRVIGLAFVGVAAWNLYKGRFMTSDDFGNRDLVDRNKNPFWFWFAVILQFVIGAVLLIGIVRF